MTELSIGLGLLFFLLASGFFSGAETGFYVLNRFRLEILAARGGRSARRIARLLQDQDVLLITCLIGTNLANQLATESCNALLEGMVAPARREILATLLLTPALFFLGEVLPKDLFRSRAETLVYRVGGWIAAARFCFFPATIMLRFLSGLLARVLRVRDPQRRRYRGREGLEEILREGFETGLLTDQQAVFARNVLRLQEKCVSAVMVPVDEVAWVPEGASIDAVLELARDHAHSRFPVLSAGRPTGYVHIGEVLRAPEAAGLETLIRSAPSYPTDASVPQVLEILRSAAVPFAFAVDEEGRLAGILSAKDLLEAIVGEFADL